MHTVVRVPDESGEAQLWVLITELGILKAERLSKDFLLSFLGHIIGCVYSEIVKSSLGENCEVIPVCWIEFGLKELLWLAWQLRFRHDELLVVLNVEDRDSEIWDTTNHEQVSAISREGHTNAFDSGIHCELVDELL